MGTWTRETISAKTEEELKAEIQSYREGSNYLGSFEILRYWKDGDRFYAEVSFLKSNLSKYG